MTDQTLISKFSSLGMDCEFGATQSQLRFDAPGLLKFGGVSFANLIKSLRAEFKGIGAPDAVEIRWVGNEYFCFDKVYGIFWHTFVREQRSCLSSLLERETKRLRFLTRIQLETLRQADKILVCKSLSPMSDEQVCLLRDAVRDYGPNAMLLMEPTEDVDLDRRLEHLDAGLLRLRARLPAPPAPAYPVMGVREWVDICRLALETLAAEAPGAHALTARR